MTKGENGVMNLSGPVSECIHYSKRPGASNKKYYSEPLIRIEHNKREKMKNQTEYEIFGVSFFERIIQDIKRIKMI